MIPTFRKSVCQYSFCKPIGWNFDSNGPIRLVPVYSARFLYANYVLFSRTYFSFLLGAMTFIIPYFIRYTLAFNKFCYIHSGIISDLIGVIPIIRRRNNVHPASIRFFYLFPRNISRFFCTVSLVNRNANPISTIFHRGICRFDFINYLVSCHRHITFFIVINRPWNNPVIFFLSVSSLLLYYLVYFPRILIN